MTTKPKKKQKIEKIKWGNYEDINQFVYTIEDKINEIIDILNEEIINDKKEE